MVTLIYGQYLQAIKHQEDWGIYTHPKDLLCFYMSWNGTEWKFREPVPDKIKRIEPDISKWIIEKGSV